MDPDDTSPILIVPYMWIGDFVRCHSVIRLLKVRFPQRPIERQDDCAGAHGDVIEAGGVANGTHGIVGRGIENAAAVADACRHLHAQCRTAGSAARGCEVRWKSASG